MKLRFHFSNFGGLFWRWPHTHLKAVCDYEFLDARQCTRSVQRNPEDTVHLQERRLQLRLAGRALFLRCISSRIRWVLAGVASMLVPFSTIGAVLY